MPETAAMLPLLPEWTASLAVFDLETTGLDVREARIVTASIATMDPSGTVLRDLRWIADPGVPIPAAASAVHGITDEIAQRDGAPAATVVAEIVATLRSLFESGYAVVIYNAPYDLSLLHHEALRYDVDPLSDAVPVIDPLVIDKAVDRYRRGKRTLIAAAEHYGVVLDDAHNATADALAAGRVALALAARYPQKLDVPGAELHSRQIQWCAEQAASFQDYMRRAKDPDFVADGGWPLRAGAAS